MSSGPAVDNFSAAPLREVRDIDKAFPGVRAGVPTQLLVQVRLLSGLIRSSLDPSPHDVVGRVSGRGAW